MIAGRRGFPGRTLVLACALAAVVAPAASRADASTAHVHVVGQSFDPQFVEILPGDTVEWDNHGSVTHTVTDRTCLEDPPGSCAFDFELTGGQVGTHRFDASGVFDYTCRIHGFSGRITVADAPGTLPDLEVSSLAVHDASAFGAPLPTTKRLEALVSNPGTAASPEALLRFQYRYRGRWETITTATLAPLNPGESRTINALWQVSGKVGDFTVRAQADPLDVVEELRESNNERWATASVLLPAGILPGQDATDP